MTITVNDVPAPTLGRRFGDACAPARRSTDRRPRQRHAGHRHARSAPRWRSCRTDDERHRRRLERTQIRYTAAAGAERAGHASPTPCATPAADARRRSRHRHDLARTTTPVAADDTYDIAAGSRCALPRPACSPTTSIPTPATAAGPPRARRRQRPPAAQRHRRVHLHAERPGHRHVHLPRRRRVGSRSRTTSTVTIYVTGPSGPPIVGNDLYEVQQGRELAIAAPGRARQRLQPEPARSASRCCSSATPPRARCVLQPDGSFVYTPLRRLHRASTSSATSCATPRAASPRRPTSASPSPLADRRRRRSGRPHPPTGRRSSGPTHFTATLAAAGRRDGHRVDGVLPPSRRRDAGPARHRVGNARRRRLRPDAGRERDVRDRRPRGDLRRWRARQRDRRSSSRATTSRAGTRRRTATSPSTRPTSRSTCCAPTTARTRPSGTSGPAGAWPWRTSRIEPTARSAPAAGRRLTCGSFPFLATCYQPSKPHIVTVTWPDGHVERFRFTPNQGSQLVPTITTAGFTAEPGTTSTLTPVGNGLLLERRRLPARRLLQRRRHLRPDPVRADRPVRHPVPARPARRPARRSPTATATPSASATTASTRRRACDRASSATPPTGSPDRRPRREHRLLLLRRRRPRRASTTRTARRSSSPTTPSTTS